MSALPNPSSVASAEACGFVRTHESGPASSRKPSFRSVMRFPPSRGEASNSVTDTEPPRSRARPKAAWAAARPVTPPPTTTSRLGSAIALVVNVQERQRNASEHLDEIAVRIERRGTRVGEPPLERHRPCFDIEVVENLHVVGEKADGREDHAPVAARGDVVERRPQVVPEPGDRGPARTGIRDSLA